MRVERYHARERLHKPEMRTEELRSRLALKTCAEDSPLEEGLRASGEDKRNRLASDGQFRSHPPASQEGEEVRPAIQNLKGSGAGDGGLAAVPTLQSEKRIFQAASRCLRQASRPIAEILSCPAESGWTSCCR